MHASSNPLIWSVAIATSFFVLLFVNHNFVGLSNSIAWAEAYGILLGLLIGLWVSFTSQYFFSFLPEKRKRAALKKTLIHEYKKTKREIAIQIIFACQAGGRRDLVAKSETIDQILTVEGFKKLFSGALSQQGSERWYAFLNGIEDPSSGALTDILIALRVFSQKINWALHEFPFSNQDALSLAHELENALVAIEVSATNKESPDGLASFLFQAFSGWSFVEGYRGFDPIQKALDEL